MKRQGRHNGVPVLIYIKNFGTGLNQNTVKIQ
jgi:hypothetical protein